MSRERMTGKAVQADELEAALAVLEKSFTAVDEKEVVQHADEIAKDEKKTVNESRPAGPAELKDAGDQNAKANANWKLTDAERNKVAARLVRLAKRLLED
jgi:hypothetical protein